MKTNKTNFKVVLVTFAIFLTTFLMIFCAINKFYLTGALLSTTLLLVLDYLVITYNSDPGFKGRILKAIGY